MKIRLLIVSVLMTFSVFGQTVPSYVPTNGLVGWWPFNGNANDESGNGNNGTVNGATLTNDRFGNGNGAYFYDGSTNYIDYGDFTLLDNSNEFTFSAWFKFTASPTPPNDWFTVLSDGSYSDPNGFGLICNSTQVLLRNYSGLPSSFGLLTSYNISNNIWCHVVGVYSLDSVSIYINGFKIDSNTNTNTSLFNTSYHLKSGKCDDIPLDPNDHEYYFHGDIDDIGIWNRALTQQEITSLYNASNPAPILSCSGAFLPQNLFNGLVGWWPFCGDADDESGNGNNGTVNGATLTSDRFGNVNSAYEFDGVDDYIQTAANFTPGNSSKSLSAWVKFDDLYDRGWIVSNNTCINGSDYDGFGFFEEGPSQSFYFYGMTNGDRLLPVNFDTTIFHHLVATYDQDTLKAYVDGVLVSSTFNPLNTNSSNGVLFGDRFTGLLSGICGNDNTIDGLFKGIIDDIGIWNRALDSSEVAQLYNTDLCTQTIAGSCDTLIFNANITGFNPVTYANQVKVYPNPASDNLVIDCGTNYTGLNGYSIRITNLLGQTVYNSPVTAQITNIQLTPPTWVNGTYVVQFVHPNGTVVDTKRIIIQ